MKRLILTIAGLASGAFLSAAATSAVCLAALFLLSPFVSDDREAEIWWWTRVCLKSLTVTTTAVLGSGVALGVYSFKRADELDGGDRLLTPQQDRSTNCIVCKWRSADPAAEVYLPCAVHPLGPLHDGSCPDWEMIDFTK